MKAEELLFQGYFGLMLKSSDCVCCFQTCSWLDIGLKGSVVFFVISQQMLATVFCSLSLYLM